MNMIRENDPEPQPIFPTGFTRRDYQVLLQTIPDRDILADLDRLVHNAGDLAAIAEEQQRFILEFADDDTPAGNRATAEILLADTLRRLEATRFEIGRRQDLYARTSGHPLARTLPPPDASFHDRVEAAKGFWPIDRFVEIVLGADLQPAGRGRSKCRCVLPGHDDTTPSFTIFLAEDRAWCFGCGRGGDLLDLCGLAFSLERVTDQLDHLERLAGKGGRS